ncbi:MAG: LuxR C-terminal-related transcriptional regulator [Micromonosporaceae bacterium]
MTQDQNIRLDTPLLTSRLTVPPAPGMVERPRLNEALDHTATRPIVLVSAPAGWGKTALLSNWARTGDSSAVAWLTVEPEDDRARLWQYVAASLRAAGVPPVTTAPLAVRTGPDTRYLSHLAEVLWRSSQPVTLVVDDAHHADPQSLDGLEFLVRHARGRFRLVLSGRVDPPLPIHQWRVACVLTELRARELAFTETEAAQLLAQGGYRLNTRQVRALHVKTEGWPAGLRLAALALPHHPDHDQFVDEFDGEHDTVADYLRAEVLWALSPQAQRVLRDTSVLTHLSGGLVDALTGGADGERTLSDLHRENAFIEANGGRPPWYRLHPCFADLMHLELRRRAPERIPELHRRAASWHTAHGRPHEALGHTLATEDWDRATSILAADWPDLMVAVHSETPRRDVPTPPQHVLSADPELTLAYAAHRLSLGDRPETKVLLQLACQHHELRAAGRPERFRLISGALKLTDAQLDGDAGYVESHAEPFLAYAKELLGEDRLAQVRARAVACSALGAVRQNVGDVDGAEAALQDGVEAAQRAGLALTKCACSGRLALLHATRGELRAAEHAAHAALESYPGPHRQPGPSSRAYLALAIVCHQRRQLDDAEGFLELAIESRGAGSEQLFAAACTVLRALLLQAREDPAQAWRVLRAGRLEVAAQGPSDYISNWLTAADADLQTLCGDPAAARKLLTRQLADGNGASAELILSLARAHLAAGDPAAAAAALRDSEHHHATHSLSLQLEAGVLRALVASATGDTALAEQLLERQLRLAEPEANLHAFLQAGPALRGPLLRHLDSGTAHWSMVKSLLESGNTRTAGDTKPRTHGEPLTAREAKVLRYLQSTLSNQEIAVELSLSIHTVKTHLRNIYRKLGVRGRRSAVRAARDQQLL